MFSVRIKVNIESIDVIFTYRPEEPEVVYKKDTFKNFAKITEKHLAGVSFLIKFQVERGLQHYCKETPALVFFCKFCEILRTLILETSVNGCF